MGALWQAADVIPAARRWYDRWQERKDDVFNVAVQKFLDRYRHHAAGPIADIIGDGKDIVNLTIDPESPTHWIADDLWKVVVGGKARLAITTNDAITMVPYMELNAYAERLLRPSDRWRAMWGEVKRGDL